MLSASFLEQHVKEVVVPDYVVDNHEDDIDSQNMEKSSSDKSGKRKKQLVLTRFEKSVIDGDVEPGTQGRKRRYKGPYARHGVQFKERRESGWVEGEESEESDGVLEDKIYDSDFDSGDSTSDSDGDCNILRLIDDPRKKRRYVHFNENDIQNPKLFPGLLPDISVSVLKIAVDKKFGIMITDNQARRTREKALKAIEGDHTEQYKLIWGYIEELKKRHPGSTVFAEYEDIPKDSIAGLFKRIYVCLRPLVEGFKVGCRKLTGLDGCHSKGIHIQ
ncbi:hypothetical protein LIER_38946 [Lithospermum erythrorhizon]|uniref:Uncharacterized protein n=1 Tax=Lithospermum erythrorhizon TaxID=34254 RepID=A0AAV3Q9X4_LITER